GVDRRLIVLAGPAHFRRELRRGSAAEPAEHVLHRCEGCECCRGNEQPAPLELCAHDDVGRLNRRRATVRETAERDSTAGGGDEDGTSRSSTCDARKRVVCSPGTIP